MSLHGGPGTFLLGVGAQKGGTSWLYEYLARSPQVAAGFAKEYHVFDALDLSEQVAFRDKAMTRARRATRLVEEGQPADAHALRLASFYADPEHYVDYFESLLRRSEEVRLSMDITPSYALLSPARFAWIRQSFEARGVRVAVVFLLRDPVERLWSSLRMHHRRRGQAQSPSVEERILAVHRQPYHEGRSRYDRTMTALSEAFEPDQVHFALYERLFRPESVSDLCAFLGIEMREPDLETRVNASPKARELPEDTARVVARHFAPAYDAAREQFGEDDLIRHWPTYSLART